jgi:hypothetical protein
MVPAVTALHAGVMTQRRRRLQFVGLLALGAGLVLAVAAPLAGDLAGLLRGYSLMLAGSAAYLVIGLQFLARRRAPQARVPAGASELVRQH